MLEATAFWVEAPGKGALRRQELPAAGPDEVLVRTLYTGVSRGTESTVFTGSVPPSEWQRMRAPFQEGDFPAPVKYGYLSVGTVDAGAVGGRTADLAGRTVFTLFPHQSAFVVPSNAVIPVPEGVPARRAVLAGAVETAVNVLWDAAPLVGDRIAVVGAGVIGCSIARLAQQIPGVVVTLVDQDPSRRAVATRLGAAFELPESAASATAKAQDLVIDASGSEAGLQLALRLARDDGRVIVASWFGDRPVSLKLGEDFHSRRLTLRSSQVGAVSAERRGTRTTTERLRLALELLQDPTFDALLTGDSSWRELPETMSALAAGRLEAICHTINWKDT